MKQIIFGLSLLSVLIISCDKNDPPPPVVTSYQSVTAGSTWSYQLTNKIAPVTVSNYVLTSTTKDTLIESRSYHVYTNSSGTVNEYYYINGNDYYTFRKLPAAFGGTALENIYLKDNVAIGTNWSQSYPVTVSGLPLTLAVTNTVIAKGLIKVVNGITYNDVIQVNTTFTVPSLPLPPGALVTDIQSFYAPKVGMIQTINKVSINFSGIVDNTDQETILKSADIK